MPKKFLLTLFALAGLHSGLLAGEEIMPFRDNSGWGVPNPGGGGGAAPGPPRSLHRNAVTLKLPPTGDRGGGRTRLVEVEPALGDGTLNFARARVIQDVDLDLSLAEPAGSFRRGPGEAKPKAAARPLDDEGLIEIPGLIDPMVLAQDRHRPEALSGVASPPAQPKRAWLAPALDPALEKAAALAPLEDLSRRGPAGQLTTGSLAPLALPSAPSPFLAGIAVARVDLPPPLQVPDGGGEPAPVAVRPPPGGARSEAGTSSLRPPPVSKQSLRPPGSRP